MTSLYQNQTLQYTHIVHVLGFLCVIWTFCMIHSMIYYNFLRQCLANISQFYQKLIAITSLSLKRKPQRYKGVQRASLYLIAKARKWPPDGHKKDEFKKDGGCRYAGTHCRQYRPWLSLVSNLDHSWWQAWHFHQITSLVCVGGVSWGEEGEEIPCSTSHSILSTAKILIGCTRNRSCHLSVSMDVIYKGFDWNESVP